MPPFYCYREEDVARIDEAIKAGCSTDAPGSFAAWLSHQTDVYAWTMSGKRHDIGDRASYDGGAGDYEEPGVGTYYLRKI